MPTHEGTLEIRNWCRCGGAIRVSASPPGVAEISYQLWVNDHTGEGHGFCTPAQARNARRRQDTARRRELRAQSR